MSNETGSQPVFSWDSDDDIPEVYLHGRAPPLLDSLAQPVERWESHARAAAKQPTAIMDSDVPDLIDDEEYLPTLTVEQAVWDSLDERSRHLWGL